LEQKRREIQIRQARFEKLAAVAQIAIKTAEAVGAIKLQAAILLANPVTALLSPLALAQVPIAIAIGAIQAAAVLATPVPKYQKGGRARKGETALTDEAGRE